ncbi:hypothetical protein TorRG33x02_024200 [Trema orientale]|uniref:Uncharacterized protein n=1 Tax=Trema orientale TaxID=63057 RepID=A0A2P5FV22_TREOI|nr:hypothetical protein TorRG33x02_024200 [Trema orientale]
MQSSSTTKMANDPKHMPALQGLVLSLKSQWTGAPVFLPCLADPARRSALGLKVSLVMLHLIYVGIIFLFDGDFIQKN